MVTGRPSTETTNGETETTLPSTSTVPGWAPFTVAASSVSLPSSSIRTRKLAGVPARRWAFRTACRMVIALRPVVRTVERRSSRTTTPRTSALCVCETTVVSEARIVPSRSRCPRISTRSPVLVRPSAACTVNPAPPAPASTSVPRCGCLATTTPAKCAAPACAGAANATTAATTATMLALIETPPSASLSRAWAMRPTERESIGRKTSRSEVQPPEPDPPSPPPSPVSPPPCSAAAAPAVSTGSSALDHERLGRRSPSRSMSRSRCGRRAIRSRACRRRRRPTVAPDGRSDRDVLAARISVGVPRPQRPRRPQRGRGGSRSRRRQPSSRRPRLCSVRSFRSGTRTEAVFGREGALARRDDDLRRPDGRPRRRVTFDVPSNGDVSRVRGRGR